MNKKVNLNLFLFVIIIFLSSCSQVKNIVYFEKSDTNAKLSGNTNKSISLFEARIKPKDLLSISVVSSEPEASRIYNLVTPQTDNASDAGSNSSQTKLQNYLVDNDGNINFPVLGTLQVKNLTRKELELKLQKTLASAFSKEMPVITIRINNFTVSVLGEVIRPGKFETNNDRMTILEGLALAGDLTIYGRRENVKILREDANGNRVFITLNLNDKNCIYSPAYFLEQNDVVYVEPNKSKSNSANYGAAESFRLSSFSVLLTLTSIALTVYSIVR